MRRRCSVQKRPLSDNANDEGLDRTLGLPAALSIGIGTMLGAGIFVFPGLAANQAGPAAVLSFGIGGIIAMLVALCTAELATAMPTSGGAYFYVSRSFGDFAGLVVGIGQTIGLVFASAFYLVAFTDYARELWVASGLSGAPDSGPLAIGAAVLLTLINYVGSKQSGRLQLAMVVLLSSLILVVFGFGFVRATGLSGMAPSLPEFSPFGTLPVFTTAAFVFTSFLGFVQISTVAGEIRNPDRALPLALIGSVLLVTVIYVTAMFVTTALLSPERIAESGSLATVALGRQLFGDAGKFLIMAAALLATISSANASVLSASRTLYALGRDRMTPAWTAKVSERFGTPHFAIVAAGMAAGGLALLNDVAILAEVASALHLLIYALICAALLQQHRKNADEYAPSFRAPASKLVAVAGALGCLTLLAFMETVALLIGGAILFAAVAWYFFYRQRERADLD